MGASNYEAALSPEEWAFADDGLPAVADLDHVKDQIWLEYSVGKSRRTTMRRHALAALCLRDQPFGFERRDVEALKRELEYNPQIREVATLQSLVDRIEALLPPERSE
jgi:hypothetical protein